MIIHSPFLSLEPYPEVPLHHMLAQAAAKAPGRAALITAEGQMLTYRRLFQAARSLARSLQERGVGRGDRVAIYSPNCLEYPVVAHGTSMAGGTLTTLNPLYRAREDVAALFYSSGTTGFPICDFCRAPQRDDQVPRLPDRSRRARGHSAGASSRLGRHRRAQA